MTNAFGLTLGIRSNMTLKQVSKATWSWFHPLSELHRIPIPMAFGTIVAYKGNHYVGWVTSDRVGRLRTQRWATSDDFFEREFFSYPNWTVQITRAMLPATCTVQGRDSLANPINDLS